MWAIYKDKNNQLVVDTKHQEGGFGRCSNYYHGTDQTRRTIVPSIEAGINYICYNILPPTKKDENVSLKKTVAIVGKAEPEKSRLVVDTRLVGSEPSPSRVTIVNEKTQEEFVVIDEEKKEEKIEIDPAPVEKKRRGRKKKSS